MNNRMPKILTSPTKNAREVVNPEEDLLSELVCSWDVLLAGDENIDMLKMKSHLFVEML